MALQLFDRVNVSATANTTVDFTLGLAVAGYQSFSVLTDGDTTYYGSSDGTEWEVGIGTYSSTGPTLTRTTILSSSNSGAAVSTFGANVNVWIDYPSEKAVYSDASGQVTLPGQLNAPTVTAENGLFLNSNVVSNSYAIPTGNNAMSVGPMTINSGVSVTVPSGQSWLIF